MEYASFTLMQHRQMSDSINWLYHPCLHTCPSPGRFAYAFYHSLEDSTSAKLKSLNRRKRAQATHAAGARGRGRRGRVRTHAPSAMRARFALHSVTVDVPSSVSWHPRLVRGKDRERGVPRRTSAGAMKEESAAAEAEDEVCVEPRVSPPFDDLHFS